MVKTASEDVFADEYWTIPKISIARVGDKTAHKLYFAVGNSTTMWEMVEDNLWRLLQVFCKSPSVYMGNMINSVYGVVESSAVRLNMLEAAATVYYGEYWARDEIRKPFRKLKQAVRLASWRRNEFAHGVVVDVKSHANNDQGQPQAFHAGCFLVAPDYMKSRHRAATDPWPEIDVLFMTKSAFRYTSSDVMSFVLKFNKLNDEITTYLASVTLHQSGHPKNIVRLLEADALAQSERLKRSSLQGDQIQSPKLPAKRMDEPQ